jgi:hypothetical protein
MALRKTTRSRKCDEEEQTLVTAAAAGMDTILKAVSVLLGLVTDADSDAGIYTERLLLVFRVCGDMR